MTKKLKWRLSSLPTPSELRELVKDKIITQEEAREILLTSEDIDERDKKSLESEIKFLRELVETLSTKSSIVESIRYIQGPYQSYPWYQGYYTWCSGTSGSVGCITASSGTTLTSSTGSVITDSSFTDIKTF